MILVVDASVAIKWYVAEERRDHALALLGGRDELTAPEFIAIELANIVWKKSMRGEVGPEMAAAVLEDLPLTFGEMIKTNGILQRAADLALALSHPVHDCLYIACAELVNGGLVTDDARLLKAVKDTRWADRLLPLAEQAAPS
jgi:predicted nucleic acid-binding protein